ncbi:unnamed protein product [Gulo gulo]|uniref:Uncharacterized protein n=1 Tax=Gulo gulo TaxID=48420 RepID=A0A9X9LTK8_GULGU|nr:unnamed protein product [Gulo gulo]
MPSVQARGHSHGSAHSWRHLLQSHRHQQQQLGQYSQLERCCDHIFDKVSMSWGINAGHVILAGLQFPWRDINGDTSLLFNFQHTQAPGILQGPLSHLRSLSLILQCFFCRSYLMCRSDDR